MQSQEAALALGKQQEPLDVGQHFTEEDWVNVIWSDESKIEVSILIVFYNGK